MFKKLGFFVLAVNGAYAMESLLPTDGNNIKQTVEDVKQVPNDSKNAVNDVTDEFSILNIDKTVQQLNDIKEKENTQKKESKLLDSKTVSKYDVNKDFGKMTRLERERYLAQQTNSLTDAKKKLLKIELYNRFSKSCQNFVQNVFSTGNADFNPKKKFYNATIAKFGVMIGLNLEQIFSDVLKSEISLNSYNKQPNFINIERQLQRVYQHLILIKNQYLYILQKRGYINKF